MIASDLVAKVKNLTPVSHAALNLVGLLGQSTADNDDVVQVLKFDNVLTAKLLRTCNSPFLGLEEPVSSVEQAVLILGHQQILHIVLSIAFSSTLTSPVPGYAAEAKELWRHSLVTALAAENIARESGVLAVPSALAFTAGLLHDIGKVVIDQVLTQDFQSAIHARVSRDGLLRCDAEKQIVGVDHAEVGKCLLELWHLPDEIIEAVENHHHPVTKPHPRLSALVHTANCLAHLVGSNLGWEAFSNRAGAATVQALAIDPRKLEDLSIAAHDSMSQVENLMKVG